MEIEKVELEDIESVETGGLSEKFSFGKKELKTSLNDLSFQLVGDLAPEKEYNNRWDRKANNFTSDARKKYIAADKEFFRRTKINMTINSGLRDVYKQADLYIRYRYHNEGNSASWPGCSLHNWGVAADMIRKNENDLIGAMKSSGWVKTVAAEPWHFECIDSPDYAKAQSKIKEFRKSTGLAYKWSENVASFYQKSKDFNARVPIFNQKLEAHKQNGLLLKNEIAAYNQSIEDLKRDNDKFNSNVIRYNNELAKAKRLYDEINDMPPGNARNNKIREYNQLVGWLKNESSRLENEKRKLQQEDNRLAVWTGELKSKIDQHKAMEAWLNNEYDRLLKLKQEIEQAQKNANDLLGKIANEVKL